MALRVILLYYYSPLDGMLVHRRATPQQYVPGNQFIHLGE